MVVRDEVDLAFASRIKKTASGKLVFKQFFSLVVGGLCLEGRLMRLSLIFSFLPASMGMLRTAMSAAFCKGGGPDDNLLLFDQERID